MKKNINFLKLRMPALIFSVLVILYGCWSMFGPKNVNLGIFTPKGFNFGIDFQGGGVHQVLIYSGINQEELRSISHNCEMGNEIQNVVMNDDKRVGNASTYIIKTVITAEEQKKIDESGNTSSKYFDEKVTKFHAAIIEKVGAEYVLEGDELAKAIEIYGDEDIPGEIKDRREDNKRVVNNVAKMSQNLISSSQSSTLRLQSIFLVIFVIFIMLLYLTIRFKIDYALGAVICLVHDTLFMLGFISIVGLEFDMTLVAALLTFMGYSVNDTIVIFDRIRENFNIMPDASSNKIFVVSINQTITRSLITSFTTLLAVVALFLFAGEKLRGFSLSMIYGIIIGTYSSIFIAAPIVRYWDKFFGKRKIKDANDEYATSKKVAVIETPKEDVDADDENAENATNNQTILTSDGKISLSKKQLKKLTGGKKK